MNTNKTKKYFLYARKSSESEDRQVQSIQDQVNRLQELATNLGLEIVNTFTEAKSAKKPDNRPLFTEMITKIENGEANGILAWQINRLSRNPIDSATIQWLLQQGVLQSIQTIDKEYRPEDNVLLFSVESGMANQFVLDLSKNVKRGMRGKVENGWRPGLAPLGYLNKIVNGEHILDVDPDRFNLIRKMWDLFLTGSYSVSKIRDIATNEWGLRTRKTRKLGSKPLTMSAMYKIFNDPFYYGQYWWKSYETGEKELYRGKHQPMISEQEHRRAQALLGKKGKPQPKTREFAFTGLIRCGECDSAITAEEKNQIICTKCKNKFSYNNRTSCPKCETDISDMKNPTILNYVYYRCTKKKSKNCSQKFMRLEDLEKQFSEKLEKLELDNDYLELALDYLRDTEQIEVKDEETIQNSLLDAIDDCQTRIKNLNKEYTSPLNFDYSLYTPEEFKKLKTELLKERANLEEEAKQSKDKVDNSLETSEKIFNFCALAYQRFNQTDDLQVKREIFSAIGSNLTLKDRKLNIDILEPYLLIENEIAHLRQQKPRLEPRLHGSNKGKSPAYAELIPSWQGRRDSNPQFRLWRPVV